METEGENSRRKHFLVETEVGLGGSNTEEGPHKGRCQLNFSHYGDAKSYCDIKYVTDNTGWSAGATNKHIISK